jgi:hypothetical protein
MEQDTVGDTLKVDRQIHRHRDGMKGRPEFTKGVP